MFISRWDVAVTGKVPESLRDKLGIAIAKRTYKAYRELLSSPRWQRVMNFGARPQRLLWASTGTKDPKASDILYVKALAAPFTVNTMPDGTLKALADHGEVGAILPADGGDCEQVLAQFAERRHRCRCAGDPASGRGGQVVRPVLERAHGGDRIQERRAQEGGYQVNEVFGHDNNDTNGAGSRTTDQEEGLEEAAGAL